MPMNSIIKLLFKRLEAIKGIGTKVAKKEGTNPFADLIFTEQGQKRISQKIIYTIVVLTALLVIAKKKKWIH